MKSGEIEHLFTYHVPTEQSIVALKTVRSMAKDLCIIIDDSMPDCADKSAAVRKLRELVMCVNAGIVLNQTPIKKD